VRVSRSTDGVVPVRAIVPPGQTGGQVYESSPPGTLVLGCADGYLRRMRKEPADGEQRKFGIAARDFWLFGSGSPSAYVVLMFASAERVLGIGIDAAQTRLAKLAQDDSLSEASRAAYLTGTDHLRQGGRPGDPAGTSRLVRVQVLDPLYTVDAMTMGMRWEASGVSDTSFPVLDADITLRAEGSNCTRLSLTGCYRAPFGWLSTCTDKTILHNMAEITLRSAVMGLAAFLEAE